MDPRTFLDMLHVAERLKDTTRHCCTSEGRPESVAEHSWRLALMAFWLKDEFKELDMNKVIGMCLIHDLGEAFTGDIPVFNKTELHEEREETLLRSWVESLPEPTQSEMHQLYTEMKERKTDEAKLYKALDSLEALIQHNEAPISSWEAHEYDLQMTYADDRVRFSEYMTALREAVREDTKKKILSEKDDSRRKMDIYIRYARLEDYDAVEHIMKQVQQLHVDLRPDIYRPVDVVMSRTEFEESVSRNCCFAAEVNGCVAGIASVLYRQVNVPHMVKRNVMYIETLAVDEQYRRMGIGKALLDHLNQLRKAQKLDGLELQVNARNEAALQMYKACGFKEKSINMEYIE